MPATIVNEKTYTVWCGECPFSTEPMLNQQRAERIADDHNAEKHPMSDQPAWIERPNGTPV